MKAAHEIGRGESMALPRRASVQAYGSMTGLLGYGGEQGAQAQDIALG
jgi:hypothetical protein